MRKQADALKVCPIPDACLLVMAQRPYRLLGLPETRSLIFLIKNLPDQVEGYLDYQRPEASLMKTLNSMLEQSVYSTPFTNRKKRKRIHAYLERSYWNHAVIIL
jgi:hypothetical protein